MFGFQRRVWWPKWTPASSSSLRPASGIRKSPWFGEEVLIALAEVSAWWPVRIRGGSTGVGLDRRIVEARRRSGGAGGGQRCGKVGGKLRGEAQRLAADRGGEGRPVRGQELALEAVLHLAAVGRVAGQRVADRGEVGADLVRAAGLQPGLQVGLGGERLEHLEMGAGLALGGPGGRP